MGIETLPAAYFYFVVIMGGFTNTVGPFIDQPTCEMERAAIWDRYKAVIGRTYVSQACFMGGKK